MTLGVFRVDTPDGPRLARGDTDTGPSDLLAPEVTVRSLLDDSTSDGVTLERLAELPGYGPIPGSWRVLAPLDEQPVWAAGVTFPRSRDARQEEALDGGDVYDRVFAARRPELFAKAAAGDAVGPDGLIGIRADSTWNVPEPELGVLADSGGHLRAYLLGNDMSSRSIEGENPLYLPQAKVYDQSCAVGPCLVPAATVAWTDLRIALRIDRAATTVYRDEVALADMRRDPADLLAWLFAAHRFPAGVVLLTGTSIVPPADFSAQPGDEVYIRAASLGQLHNTVTEVGVRLT
jgi:2-dehydro-3-deoxy-D-arabinonate dehydratase